MFFKRIEMVGFKSFATRTVCDFIPGTTIIVGPNGCGKSNILDAIKWVLGEQAASQMRGKKMQDVIFAGSASFKPLGVAQVTLTIDNQSRILPTEFDEVQITRRLFRNGESEYLINKSPSRLRDVQELFLGTGVGKSAYSMLEQGRVHQIIDSKPIERRFLIEEAAGISKFKMRKLEALRKLERTDIDLSRLNDLLSEVERQVASLKRQAGKAERYKEIFDACRAAEQQLIALRAHALNEQLAGLATQLAGLHDRLAALRAELATKSAAEEQARERELDLSDQLRDDNQAIFDLKAAMTEAEHQIGRLNDQIGAHGLRTGQIQEELRDYTLRQQELELRLVEAEERHSQAEDARQRHTLRHQDLSAEYASLQVSVRSRTQLIESISAEANAVRGRLARAENDMRMAEGMIAHHTQDHERASTQLANLEDSVLAQMLRQEELTATQASLGEMVNTLQAELEAQRATRATRQADLAGAMKELESAARQLNQNLSRLETLRELSASYEGYYQGVREVMLAADDRQLRGIVGVAANLIRAEGEHEVAIEVALATHLQDIITRTAEEARDAIDFLKRTGRGRATFLPLDRMQTTPLDYRLRQVLSRPGVLGIASELVQFDRQIQVAVDFMLGQTIVVRDLETALDLGREGFRARYVSLDGQLINPAGSMTGGSIKATGLMTREREIRDLAANVTGLEQKQERLRGDIERVQIELTTAHNRIEAVQLDLDARRLELNSAQKDLESAKRALADAEQTRNTHQTQLARLAQDMRTLHETVARANAEREELTSALVAAEARLAAEREQASHEGTDIFALGTSVAEARADVEKARERSQEAITLKQTTERDLEALGRQRQNRQREIEELAAQDVLLREQIDRIKSEMEGSSAEFDKLALRLNHSQSERETLLTNLRQLTQSVELLQRDERELDNQTRELELRQAELHARAEVLRAQCEEQFQQDLASLIELVNARRAESGVAGPEPDAHALAVDVTAMKDRLERMGPVNLAALDEYREQAARLDFLQAQRKDLTEAKDQLTTTITRLDETTRKLFHETFEAVRANFIEMFRRLFNGGRADLILEAPDGLDPLLDGGIEIMAQPPGKNVGNLTLMSGGEKAMTAIALLFGLFMHKPSPFCILDEIDAPLDDVNVERFKQMIAIFNRNTQFMIITHNKLTMELGDALYGVTMEESGVSKLVSVRFEQAEELVEVG